MSEQEDENSVLSRVSISTGVIPFPSMDSSLLRRTLSTLEESSLSSEPHEVPLSQNAISNDASVLPFPTNPLISDKESPSPSPEPMAKDSTSNLVAEESHVTTSSSSKLTSSDKLSALPSSTSAFSPNVARNARSPTSLTNIKRGHRRSLDATTSLPSFSLADADSRVLSHGIWGTTTSSFNARTETSRHPTPENASGGKETPKQRVSFESDHSSLPTMRSVGQVFSRRNRGSDPTSPAVRASAEHRDDHIQDIGSRSQSPPRSGGTSPLRIFQQWSSGLLGHRISVEERFVPIDPFRLHSHIPFCCFPAHTHHDLETGEGSASSGPYDCEDLIPTKSIQSFFTNVQFFIVDTLPRQMYLIFLLRLPAMYFSRVSRIFEDAEVSKPDIQRMIDASGRGGGNNGGTWEPNTAAQSTPAHIPMTTLSPPGQGTIPVTPRVDSTTPVASMIHMPLPFPDEWTPPLVSPALIRFKHSWEAFIDSLLKEWKTLNVVSALLASTILTIFQIPDAADDPVTRTAALLSLVCAVMSLSYGCMYIVRFGMMRNMFHASRWAEEAQKTNTSIWWNVWVLLAMPAIWIAWAMVLFITAILSFVWRTGSVSDPSDRPPVGDRAALGPRIAITGVFCLGLVYLAMIIRTLKKYGSHEGLPRMLPPYVGMRHGGGTPTHGNRTEVGGAGEKKIRARDIDAAMERRGRRRERSGSCVTRIRRREGDVERRQTAAGVKGMHGLGIGSRIVEGDHNSGSEAEMDANGLSARL